MYCNTVRVTVTQWYSFHHQVTSLQLNRKFLDVEELQPSEVLNSSKYLKI
jgi:hypothetical protein